MIKLKISILGLLLMMSFAELYAQQIRIMSYNIRLDVASDSMNSWPNRKEAMADLLKYYEPTIFGVQEALPHQITDLLKSLPQYKFVGVGRDDGQNKGEYSAIFYDSTQFKVLEESTFWLSETPKVPSLGWDAAYKRVCSYALLETKADKRRFWVFNTHFDHIGEIARQNSAQLILQKIGDVNTLGLPVILMGDFNSLPESQAIQQIANNLNDAFIHSATKPYGPIGTFTGFNAQKVPTERIDYLFFSGFEVVKFRHIDDKRNDNYFVSDHLPVMADFKFIPIRFK